ncbi:MAG: Uncharacterised protein [Rhodospirillaceae bacterium]|nr:MAG: Uncharacterised protein [Rhodospirillaceae bacterium]
MPIIIAEPTANKCPVLNSTKPGRTITTAPNRPISIASQRRIRTISPRKIMAPIVVKIGARKLKAVWSVIGIIAILLNQSHIAQMPTKDRSRCAFICGVFLKFRPARIAKGRIRTSAKNRRIKTVCAGCIPACAANRPSAAIIVKLKQQKNIHVTA